MIYTIAEAQAVLDETKRITAEDARRRPDPREPRASAQTDPPARAKSFHDIIVAHMKRGATQAQATRLAAIERPDLRREFVELSNKHRQLESVVSRAAANRRRNRNR